MELNIGAKIIQRKFSYPTRDMFGVEGDAFCSRNSQAVITTGSENNTCMMQHN
jgi:hypothetical protein